MRQKRLIELTGIIGSVAILFFHAINNSTLEYYAIYFQIFCIIMTPLEGLRALQLPMISGYLVYLWQAIGPYSFCYYLLMTSLTLWARRTFGICDFQTYPDCPEAPYACGFTTFRSSKFGNEVQVYYPISKNSANRQKYPDVPFLTHGDKTLRGLSMSANFPGFLGPIVFRPMAFTQLDVYEGAPLAKELEGESIVPLFFSHGLTANANLYSRLNRDLARHGYLVFTFDHLDGSCLHTIDADGKDYEYIWQKENYKYIDKNQTKFLNFYCRIHIMDIEVILKQKNSEKGN